MSDPAIRCFVSGQKLVPELFSGKTVGTDATMTTSGWSNSDVFRTYMKDHFYICSRTGRADHFSKYDGQKSHISLDLIDWARDNNIILFVLPPHCSAYTAALSPTNC